MFGRYRLKAECLNVIDCW